MEMDLTILYNVISYKHIEGEQVHEKHNRNPWWLPDGIRHFVRHPGDFRRICDQRAPHIHPTAAGDRGIPSRVRTFWQFGGPQILRRDGDDPFLLGQTILQHCHSHLSTQPVAQRSIITANLRVYCCPQRSDLQQTVRMVCTTTVDGEDPRSIGVVVSGRPHRGAHQPGFDGDRGTREGDQYQEGSEAQGQTWQTEERY